MSPAQFFPRHTFGLSAAIWHFLQHLYLEGSKEDVPRSEVRSHSLLLLCMRDELGIDFLLLVRHGLSSAKPVHVRALKIDSVTSDLHCFTP